MTSPLPNRLDAYWFHEREWDDYDDLRERFKWDVPDPFNVATVVCDRWAAADGERVALVAEEPTGVVRYTFADLEGLASRFADYLNDSGVGSGDRVGVNGTQRVEVLATHLACWKLGAVSVPLSVRFGRDAIRYRLRDSGARACVVTGGGAEAFRAVADDLPALETRVVVDVEPVGEEVTFTGAVEGRADEKASVDTGPEETATIIYTSGTTGEPKGVVLPHRHLLGVLPTALCTVFDLQIDEGDVLRTPVEWSWVGSLTDVVLPALFYGKPVVAADLGPFDPGTELGLLERHGVTITGGPPTAYRIAFDHPTAAETDLGCLRVLVLGGEAAGEALVERAQAVVPDAAVHEVYGQTEAPVLAGDCEALDVVHRPGKMGRPSPGHDVRVLNPETGEPLDAGEVGEFAVGREGDPVCFAEYWNGPDETARKVDGGWLRCEDLGSIDEAGYLEFHSRRDDVIVSAGYKLSPAAVEDALAAHEAVVAAGVIGVPDETRGEIVKAFVQLSDGYRPTDGLGTELQGYVRDRLAEYEYPRELEFVGELPLTSTGKVRRRDLREHEGLLGTD